MTRVSIFGLLVLLGPGCGDDTEPAAESSGTQAAATESPGTTSDIPGSTTEAGSTAADASSGVPAACSDSPDAIADCVQEDLYLATLEFVAQARSPTEPHWQVVQDHLAEQLAEFGYEVELDVYDSGVNVLGRLRGTLGTSDVVVSAHYDSVFGCQGADDNASGVAGALEAARVLAMGEYEQDLLIAFWDQEELGLIGATSYIERAVDRGDSIAANYNLEMIGYTDDTPGAQTIPAGFDALFPEGYGQIEDNEFRGDFITVVADDLIAEGAASLVAQAQRLELPVVHIELNSDLKNNPLLSDLRRSDHAAFWEVDYPAMMITDTSEFRFPNYHCDPEPDVVEDLDHAFSRKVVAATVGAAATTLVLVGPADD
ncbi:MAG: M28 family peptidase [Nannocystaceae bacterium]|nr:M28 family peptidase [Nannocystaceae bacterium]